MILLFTTNGFRVQPSLKSLFQRISILSAAIMAMRHPRLTVFTGAMSALALMHVMSAFFGYATTVIPRVYTYYLSSFLFAVTK